MSDPTAKAISQDLYLAIEAGIGIIASSFAMQMDATKLYGELAKQIHNAEVVGAHPLGLRLAREALKAVDAARSAPATH